MDNNDILKKVISHSKANGFIYQSSEIYDGLSAVYDYGPYGSRDHFDYVVDAMEEVVVSWASVKSVSAKFSIM